MSALEVLVEELKTLPPTKLAEAAEIIHRLKVISDEDRQKALDQAYGCLSEQEANTIETAIQTHCERIDASQW